MFVFHFKVVQHVTVTAESHMQLGAIAVQVELSGLGSPSRPLDSTTDATVSTAHTEMRVFSVCLTSLLNHLFIESLERTSGSVYPMWWTYGNI